MKIDCILCLALCVGSLSGSAWAGPCYDVEILWGQTCGIFGPASVSPEGISSDGTIIGSVEQCAQPELKEGFVWPIEDDPFIIPRPTGATNLYANCINDRGQIGVQITFTDNEFGFLAHIYDLATGSFTPIGVPPRGEYSEPSSINNLSQACGKWGAPQNGFVATSGDLFDLNPILDGTHSDADDINDHGSIVGWMGSLSVFTTHRGFLYRDGKVIDFGVAPGCYNSIASAVNVHDEVACTGGQSIPGGDIGHAFVWREGDWTQLAHLPEYEDMSARDINDFGVVIGNLVNPGNSAYVSIDGVTYDLKLRIPADSGVDIRFAKAVNNAGQIACEGRKQHPFFGWSTVGVRLTPRPPQPADFTDDCAVNGEDLMILLQSWGPIRPSPAGRGAEGEGGKRNANPAADLDGNGIVNGFDLAMLLAAWG